MEREKKRIKSLQRIYIIFAIIFLLISFIIYMTGMGFSDIHLIWSFIATIFFAISIIFLSRFRIKMGITFGIVGCITYPIFIIWCYFILGRASLIPLFGIFPLIGVFVIMGKLHKYKNLEEKIQEKKTSERKIKEMKEIDKKIRLIGMIKVEKRINLRKAQKYLGVPESEIKGFIYDLVGQGKLEGEFQGNEFIISSNIDDFIKALNYSFLEWEDKTDRHVGKIDY
ncbi:MAG: hypothetical protein CEE42_16005 [Promethearchaeota archaeon Loki_b31]|nr:MAG: hypothetical protein CEE42_16005 [Candidatus Lokiarchaeota archaeon Loki_b31]